jgi:hypothetical protein
MIFNLNLFYKIVFWISLIGLIAIISDFGFSQTPISKRFLDDFYFIVIGIGITATFLRYFHNLDLLKRNVFFIDLLSVIFTLWVFYMYLFVGVPFETDLLLENPIWVKIAVAFTFIREYSELKINFKRNILNPV